jgi:hypothetical protein
MAISRVKSEMTPSGATARRRRGLGGRGLRRDARMVSFKLVFDCDGTFPRQPDDGLAADFGRRFNVAIPDHEVSGALSD